MNQESSTPDERQPWLAYQATESNFHSVRASWSRVALGIDAACRNVGGRQSGQARTQIIPFRLGWRHTFTAPVLEVREAEAD